VLTEDADVSMKDGLLGMSFLKRFNFGIDLKNTKLTLERL
jgi:predicted aspartyl protease